MTEAPIRLDAATRLWRGRRVLQEDALLGGVAEGAQEGLIALADGCGGHARGDLASNIAADVALRAFARAEGDVPARLRQAAEAANLAVYARAQGATDCEGMSTTLLLVHVSGARLHWASVGDSPLWLMRSGRLKRLNATHSLARHLDLLVEMGEMDAAEAASHPARSCLTSALGGDTIEEIDCPQQAVALAPNDIVLAASDGVLTLDESAIAALLDGTSAPAATLAEELLEAVHAAGDAAQDNTSVALVRVECRGENTARPAAPEPRPARLSRRTLAAIAEALGRRSVARVTREPGL